ncbi:Short-chain dehydrogenase/reductase family 16C member 6 [Tolypocladium ophioglossoides CBS 100239]|uniref:Short-chain dehydrogenase/reductase 3 n=1 Tax=Tolypocladium ophioglossoides (strain CBS 100239) TaxID=1163406 RepID=A0A0L0NL02_TOLOC|nr:Short-chain dehydrogenase/reductase family 16C member 6 [Tolypocladium ophioglossoides CBS 100239]
MPMHNGILPREGFCADVILRVIRRTALNPTLLLPLVLLARLTKKGQDLSILHPTAARRLRILFYYALARRASAWLSDGVRNNWSDDRYDWSREIVLVTGGAAGIGGSMVRFFEEEGVKVVVLDIQPMSFTTWDTTTASKVRHFHCDVRSPESVNAVADTIRAEVGHPTIIISNAGVARGKTLLDSEPGGVRFTFDVNTLAHFWITKAFLPNMVARNHGMVVTVSSFASWLTIPNMIDYGASKAAAMAFHEGITSELKTRYNAPKVRTVSVHPGHTRTALFKGFSQGADFLLPRLEPDSGAEAVVRQVLTGRSGHVILPEAGGSLAALRAYPDWYSIRLRARVQGNMKRWSGRQVVEDVDASYDGRDSQQNEASSSTVLVSGE